MGESIASRKWNLPEEERGRLIEEKEKEARANAVEENTTFSQLRKETKKGAGYLGRGIVKTTKGIAEIVVGTAKEVDAAALGLGAIAIMTVGELPYAVVFAVSSREKNIIDTNRELLHFAQTSKFARLAGYPLLALAGGYGIQQAAKMFK